MRCLVLALVSAFAVAVPAGGVTTEGGRPPELRDVGFDQRLGERVPLDLVFRNETGETVALGALFGERPVVLVPAYYECPMLCPVTLTGLVSALRAVSFTVGKEFTVIVVSFSPRDTSALAAAKKASILGEYRRPDAATGWHFLTGDAPAVGRLMEAIGFRYAWDEGRQQFAHASGLVVLTPGGTLARYFYGVEFSPRDLRLALVEASQERIGSVVDQLLLFCFHYDPATGRYSRVALGAVRVGGALTLIALGAFVTVMWRREVRRGLTT